VFAGLAIHVKPSLVPQRKFYSNIQTLGDLKRLQLVLEAMPDEERMRAMEKRRGRGRNDYPIREIWNSLLAGIVFQHDGIEKLRRE
jgi:hypothetical protein